MLFKALPLISSIAIAGILVLVESARGDLAEYVKKPEPAFAWKLKEKISQPDGTIYDLHLVSQVWQGITWEHQLQVYQPKEVAPNGTMVLWNTGGAASKTSTLLGMEFARRIGVPVAFLYHVPNQPLLDGKREDALIAETFVRYLDTKDENWPLLFPMVKSVVKAMDALQAFGKEEWKTPVKDFIVCGASKRGWTSWLTATADPRVKAIAPLVIDTLNMREQLPYQLKAFGTYSEMIKDYTVRGLVPMPNTPEAKRLWGMVDPWVHRDKLTMPKFLINGNNDPYWTTDALNFYWNDLPGEKWVLYVPNAGHDLRQRDKIGLDQFDYVVNGLAAFARHQVAGKSLPKLVWNNHLGTDKLPLTVEATPAPLAARVWVAEAPTLDFRKAKWVERPIAQLENGKLVATIDPPKEGCQAHFIELDYEIDGLKYHLSTQIRVTGQAAPAKP